MVDLFPKNHMALTEISPPDFDVELQIVYSTSDNFTEEPIYARSGCYLHQDAAERLSKSVKLAASLGLRFKIFDAFRPSEAQWALWRHTPDSDFLADPRHGSPHSRGVAVDLTLLDSSGTALEMGTAFDAFTPLSHHGSMEVSAKAQHNRHLLLGIMTTAGWDFYQNEWWHYQLFETQKYELLSDSDLPVPMMHLHEHERQKIQK